MAELFEILGKESIYKLVMIMEWFSFAEQLHSCHLTSCIVMQCYNALIEEVVKCERNSMSHEFFEVTPRVPSTLD